MAKAMKFEPDVKVRTKNYKIGCIGAGMIMAECHLAAYKEAGFPGRGDRLAHQGQRRRRSRSAGASRLSTTRRKR